MTMPSSSTNDQILIKLGEMGVQLAVISEQLKDVPDHELRIRALEQFRWKATGLAIAAGGITGIAGALIDHLKLH